jgi:hypothetical protein
MKTEALVLREDTGRRHKGAGQISVYCVEFVPGPIDRLVDGSPRENCTVGRVSKSDSKGLGHSLSTKT